MADNDSRAGARYTSPDILDYVNRTHVRHDAGLAKAFETPAGVPAIQVGPSEGRLLGVLVRLVGARRVVEVGTLMGYSAIHMARALQPDGKLWTIEYDHRHAELARANIAAAGLADRVTVVEGAGREVLPTLVGHGPFDAVFIDADKAGYDYYGRWALENLRTGGIVIADNAYLFGELLDDTETARAMRRFHEQIAAASESVCVPTPDGLVVAIKR
jgi:caffeoyl-CoA O-methyltransferase